jgi:hypothetical protein
MLSAYYFFTDGGRGQLSQPKALNPIERQQLSSIYWRLRSGIIFFEESVHFFFKLRLCFWSRSTSEQLIQRIGGVIYSRGGRSKATFKPFTEVRFFLILDNFSLRFETFATGISVMKFAIEAYFCVTAASSA